MLAVSAGPSALAVDNLYAIYDSPDDYRSGKALGARVNVADAPPTAPMDCPRIGGDFNALSVVGRATDRPALVHPDLNLRIRGYAPGPAFRGLVDYNGPADDRAPQLAGLVSGRPVQGEDVRFASTDIVNDWDWHSYRRAEPLRDWPATLAQLDAPKGTAVRVPHSGYAIGDGYQVLVLFADPERVTLKYTREDNVVRGYTLHIENICVDPSLLSLYERLDDEGRGSLPAMPAGQAFGVARPGGPRFAIRDTGQFMDPRARKDWWRGW